MTPPLKKRRKVFLDESSDDSTNVWNSNDDADNDTISDKDSVGGGGDDLSDSVDSDIEELFKRGRKKSSISGEKQNDNSSTKKKTPEMIESPLSVEDDDTKFDDELDFIHMNTQESMPNNNKLLTQQNNRDILDVKHSVADSIQHPVELDDSDTSLEDKEVIQKKKKKESKSKRQSTDVKSHTKESQTSTKQSSSHSPTSKSDKSKKETSKKSKSQNERSSNSKSENTKASTTKPKPKSPKPSEEKNAKDPISKGNLAVVTDTSTKTQATVDASKNVSSSKSNTNNTTNSKPTKPTTVESTKPQKKNQTFQSQVLAHLLTTLRPFTIKTLATELRTTSIALNHLMLSMVDKRIVHKREWGKNNKELYWVDLKNATNEVYGKDHVFDPKETEDAKVELQHYRGQIQRLHNETESLNAQISNQDLERQLKEEETIVNGLRTRLNGAKERISGVKRNQQNQGLSGHVMKQPRIVSSMNTKPVIKNSKQIKKEFNNMRLEWKNRKQKCMDFIDNLSDAMEKRPKDVMKLLDLETDEIVGVKFPPKQDI